MLCSQRQGLFSKDKETRKEKSDRDTRVRAGRKLQDGKCVKLGVGNREQRNERKKIASTAQGGGGKTKIR